LPGWLLRALGVVGGNRQAGTMLAWFGAAEEARRVGPEIKVKYLCGPCNSGWMSKLETQAKPLITPLLADLAVPLSSTEQRILARWSIKTAIVLEATGAKDRPSLYTPADRRLVATAGSVTLPAGTTVWIGRHSQSNVTFGGARWLLQPVAIGPTKDLPPFEEGYGTTLGLGRVVLQVLRVKLRQDSKVKTATLHIRPGPWVRSLIQIWPEESALVQWPPASSFSETGTTLEELNRRFRGLWA
jgi:hypothetical protein